MIKGNLMMQLSDFLLCEHVHVIINSVRIFAHITFAIIVHNAFNAYFAQNYTWDMPNT